MAADQVSPEAGIEHVQRVLGRFEERKDIIRKYVLIEADLSEEEVVDVARRLHRLEPQTWYCLMDSDREFDTMLDALPATRNRDFSQWPAEYIEQHFVARIIQEMKGDGDGGVVRYWLVVGGPPRPHLEGELP